MGWFRNMPSMQTYHGVVSLDHSLKGSLNVNRELFEFDEGRGYIEKDWGKSFPEAWVWMQSNHFGTQGTSFMMSIGRVPYLGMKFTGYLGFFLHAGEIYRFGTYTNAKVRIKEYDEEHIVVRVKGNKFIIELIAQRHSEGAGILASPVDGQMQGRVAESLDATIQLKVMDRKGQVIFEGTGTQGGLELAGNLEKLLKGRLEKTK